MGRFRGRARDQTKNGTRYFYYLCRGKQDHTCDLPYFPVETCERAVENHYTRIRLPAELRAGNANSVHWTAKR